MPGQNARRHDCRRPGEVFLRCPRAARAGVHAFRAASSGHRGQLVDGATSVVERDLWRSMVDRVEPDDRVIPCDAAEDVLGGRHVSAPIIAKNEE